LAKEGKIMRKVMIFLSILLLPFMVNANDFAYLFSHGLNCNSNQALYYEKVFDCLEVDPLSQIITVNFKNQQRGWSFQNLGDLNLWVVQQPLVSFNYPDANNKSYDRTKTSLGQANEIKALKSAYLQAKSVGKQIVLMGMSRGASTILNFLGIEEPQDIAAAIVESPFDSIFETLQTKFQQARFTFIPQFIINTFPNMLFGKFDANGIFPITIAHKIKKDLPILIICSLEDSLIPAINTANIYFKLLESGHEHAYLLLVDKGKHAYLLWHEDGDLYMYAVHAFYKKYGLPHNPFFAAYGEAILSQCKPSRKEVEDAISNNKTFIQRLK
jgi:hypothetical protein